MPEDRWKDMQTTQPETPYLNILAVGRDRLFIHPGM